MSTRQSKLVTELVDRIKPLLAGHPSEIQSAVLADLTAIWLASIQDMRDPESPRLLAVREEFFANWIASVRQLVPVNSAIIRERENAKRSGHSPGS